jgi:hypothetical protein
MRFNCDISIFVVALFCAVFGLGVTCGPVRSDAVPAPVNSAVQPVELPEGTPVQMIISQDLQSGVAKVGDSVNFQVLKPVIVDNQVLVPAGSIAYGFVTKSKKPGVFGAPGKLAFTCEAIQLTGVSVPLRANEESKSGASETQKMADNEVKGEALGAVMSGGIPSLGPSAVLGFLHGGGNVTVHRGQELTMYVASNTPIVPAPRSAVAKSNVITLVVNGLTTFTLKSGQQITGKLLGFDGTNFQIATQSGNQSVAASDVAMAKSM